MFYLLLVLVFVVLVYRAFVKSQQSGMEGFHGGPESDLPFYLSRSPIHGLGVFPTRPFHPGRFLFEIIDPSRKVTEIGKKVNHCWKPNTKLVKHHDGSWWLVSFAHVGKGEELTVDYRDTPPFIKKPNPKWTCGH